MSLPAAAPSPGHAPRHITIFTVPAGTPTPITGSKVKDEKSLSAGATDKKASSSRVSTSETSKTQDSTSSSWVSTSKTSKTQESSSSRTGASSSSGKTSRSSQTSGSSSSKHNGGTPSASSQPSGSSTSNNGSTTTANSKQNKENPGNFTVKLGRLLPWTPSVDHWGIYIESEKDIESGKGLCVELGRSPDGGIIVLHRTRREREKKEPQRGIKYEQTNVFTCWDDASIVQCAKDICRDQLYGDYNVVARNCQTFVNILVQRIAVGEPWTPRRTTDHVFAKGPNKKKLVAPWESDMVKAEDMKRKGKYRAPDFSLAPPTTNNVPTNNAGQPVWVNGWTPGMGRVLDLNPSVVNSPLSLQEQRDNSYYLSRSLDEVDQGSMPMTSSGDDGISPPRQEERLQALQAHTESGLWTLSSDLRRMNALAVDMDTYLTTSKIPPERAAEKEARLREANSAHLRQRMVNLKAEYRNSVYTKERRKRTEALKARLQAEAEAETEIVQGGGDETSYPTIIIHEDQPGNKWPPEGMEWYFKYQDPVLANGGYPGPLVFSEEVEQ
ncbi:hypothetical protein V8F06_008573 [Rhypophila decipiens]